MTTTHEGSGNSVGRGHTAERKACPGCSDPIPDRYTAKGVCGNCYGTTDDPWLSTRP